MQKLNWFQRTILGRQLSDSLTRPDTSEKIVVLHEQPIGSAGTRNYAGYDAEEYLQTLTGYRRADEFDKIRRSDPAIIMLLNSIKNLIRSAVWNIEPGEEDSEEAQQDADFIKHIFFEDMETSFRQFINEALSMCDFGHAVFEVTNKIVQNHPVFGSYVGIKNLGWRSPRTIQRWNLNKDDGKLLSITQWAFGDLARNVEIPAQFLMLMSLNLEGSNFEGVSMIRPCYGSYKRKLMYLKLNAIGVEKFAIPTPVGSVPDGTKPEDPQYISFVEALENFTGHESQHLIKPSSYGIELVTNTYDPQKVEYSIEAEDKRMTGAFLANFLTLSMSGTGGSYALSNDLSDFFMAGLDYIATTIETEVNKVAANIIKANFGEREKYPRLVHSDISDKAGKELADSLKTLVDGQIIIPDDKLEAQTRERFKLSKKGAEGQRKPLAHQQYPGPVSPLMSENPIMNQIKLAEKYKR